MTKDWSKSVNLSFLGIPVVDSWLVYKGFGGYKLNLAQAEYYEVLARRLIKISTAEMLLPGQKSSNVFDQGTAFRPRVEQDSDVVVSGKSRCGAGLHLTPTITRRKNKSGELETGVLQGRCIVGEAGKTTMVRCLCRDSHPIGPAVDVCSTRRTAPC